MVTTRTMQQARSFPTPVSLLDDNSSNNNCRPSAVAAEFPTLISGRREQQQFTYNTLPLCHCRHAYINAVAFLLSMFRTSQKPVSREQFEY